VALGAAGLLSIRRDTTQAATSTGQLSSEPKSAQHNSFDDVVAQLDRGGSLYFYLGTEQWLAGLSQQIASLRDLALPTMPAQQDAAERENTIRAFNIVTDLVKKSGIEEITGIGASSVAIDPGFYRNKLFVHHYSGKGNGFLWSAFGGAPHRLDALDFLPADTAFASFTDMDLTQIYGVVRQEIEQSGIPQARQALGGALAQFSATAGMSIDDLLKSLGGSMGMILTLDPSKPISVPLEGRTVSIPTPQLAILLRVKDDRIFSQIDRLMGANPSVIRVNEPSLRMRTTPMPVVPQLELRPTVAQWTKDYFILASNEKIVRDLIAAQKPGYGLKASPQFASLAAGLPGEGNAFQIVTQQFGETWSRLQREIMKAQPNSTPEQTALMEKLLGYQKPGMSYSISAHLENGWLVVGKGTEGAGRMLAPLMLAPAAVAAGFALPVFAKVSEKGKATQSLSQAKQIVAACKLYAVDNNGKFPPSLEALVPRYLHDTKIFVSPFAPNVPMGYDYKQGLGENSPRNAVLVEDKFSPQANERIVGYVDGSGAATSTPRQPVP
jgi:hypothetical protein